MQDHAGRVDDLRDAVEVERRGLKRPGEDRRVLRDRPAATRGGPNLLEDALQRELHERPPEPGGSLSPGGGPEQRVDGRDLPPPIP